jgi:hypothetical protein
MTRNLPQAAKFGIFIALFVLSFIAVLLLYLSESNRSFADYNSPNVGENYIDATVKIVNIEPIRGDVSGRLQMFPMGNLNAGANKLSKAIKLEINSSAGRPERVFNAQTVMEPVDVIVSIYDGVFNDYPFDRHMAFLELELKDNTSSQAGIPTRVNIWGNVPGFYITPVALNENTESYLGFNLAIRRSWTSIIFAIFIGLGMWIVSIIVLIQAIVVYSKGRMPETGMFTYMATLTFALPAIRNIQPGIPPLGTLSDFLGFFWAEGLAVTAMLIVAYCWLVRYGES